MTNIYKTYAIIIPGSKSKDEAKQLISENGLATQKKLKKNTEGEWEIKVLVGKIKKEDYHFITIDSPSFAPEHGVKEVLYQFRR